MSINIQNFISMEQQKKSNMKYRLIAHVVQLNLNKNLNFQTKVSWKRNVNKAETESAMHRNCCSLFDQRLELEMNLLFNHQQSRFQPKMTQFSVMVIYQGKIKSGGFVKYDVAQIVNNNINNQKVILGLVQCPDPKATLEIIFDYQIISEASRSLFNQLSMLSPSGESNLSLINFGQEEKNQLQNNADIVPVEIVQQKQNTKELALKQKQIHKINNILDKFQSISKRVKPTQKSLFFDDQNSTKNQSLEISMIPNQNEEKLKTQISQLQKTLELKQALIKQYQKKLEEAGRTIQQFEIKLQLSQQKLRDLKASRDSVKIDHFLIENERKYRQLYQKSQKELEQMRDRVSTELNFSKNQNFSKFVQEVRAIDEIPQFEEQKLKPQYNICSQKIEQLQRENVQLQTKIAEMSHNIAQLFNAAYEYGGAKLLDYLQGSIGLTQQDA